MIDYLLYRMFCKSVTNRPYVCLNNTLYFDIFFYSQFSADYNVALLGLINLIVSPLVKYVLLSFNFSTSTGINRQKFLVHHFYKSNFDSCFLKAIFQELVRQFCYTGLLKNEIRYIFFVFLLFPSIILIWYVF